MNALIVYHTISGHTRRAAEDIAQGLRSEGATVRLVPAADFSATDAAEASIVVVGSPCHAGSLGLGSGLSGRVQAMLKALPTDALRGKTGGAFSVHCAYGGHRTVHAIERRLAAAGVELPASGIVVRAGVPFSVATGPLASEQDRQRLRRFGVALARASRQST